MGLSYGCLAAGHFCSLDSFAYRPCGTSSWCFLLICVFLVLGSDHFVALRFAHLHHAFFLRRFGIFARCIRCSMSHCYLRRARKALECIFFSDLARLRDLLACLKLYIVFSLVDLLWFRLRPARTQLCACTAAGTCSTSRDFSSRRSFGSCFSDFLLLSGGAFVYFDSLPDQIPTFCFFQALH